MNIRELYKVIYHSIVENDEIMFPRNTMTDDEKLRRDEFISRKAHTLLLKMFGSLDIKSLTKNKCGLINIPYILLLYDKYFNTTKYGSRIKGFKNE